MKTTDSSLFSGYDFDENSWTLTLVFRATGEVRHYGDFPPELYDEFDKAASKGAFFNQKIRNHFEVAVGGTVSEEEVRAEAAQSEEDELGITDADLDAAPGLRLAEPEILTPETAIATLAPKSPKVDALTAELHRQAAVKIVVTDAVSQSNLENHIVGLTGMRKALHELIDPYRDIAYRTYEAIQKLNKSRLDPADEAIKQGKHSLGIYLSVQQEKARAEQRRLQAEAEAESERDRQRRTEELRLQVASQQAEEGDTAQAEISLFSEEIQAPPVPTYVPRVEMPQATQFSGRKSWKAEVTNLELLVLDVAEGIKVLKAAGSLQGHAPISMLEASMTQLNKRAKADERMDLFPGVRAYNDVVLTGKRSK